MTLSPVMMDSFTGDGPLDSTKWAPERDGGSTRASRSGGLWYTNYFMSRCPTAHGGFTDFQLHFKFEIRKWLERPADRTSDLNHSATEAFDGLNIWARYGTQYGPLYTCAFVRRDGQVVVKRKIPDDSASSNKGRYYVIGKTARHDAVLGKRYDAILQVEGSNNVHIRMYINGELLLDVVDMGELDVPPTSGRIGIRTDCIEAAIDDWCCVPLLP